VKGSCEPGCTCARHHRVKRCPDGCTCGRHSCRPDCKCSRHNPKTGLDHHRWTGNSASKGAKHKRVKAKLGFAWQYNCIECGRKACDWSQTKGTDGLSIHDYEPMCRKCHIAYDACEHPRDSNGRFTKPGGAE
jgi:hypothetical protein